MKKTFILLLFILASRLFFLSQYEDFFDSVQYFNRFRHPDLLNSLVSGHPPFHPLYIFFGQLIYRLLAIFGLENPGLTGALISAIFGVGAIAVFYFLVKTISGSKKTALLASILASMLPFVWISQITTLIDSVNVFFTLLALLLFWLGLNNKKILKQQALIIGSGLSFGLALLAHTQAGFWIILFVLVFVYYLFTSQCHLASCLKVAESFALQRGSAPDDSAPKTPTNVSAVGDQTFQGWVSALRLGCLRQLLSKNIFQNLSFAIGPLLAIWIYIKLMGRAAITNDSLGQGLADQFSTAKGALRFLLLDNAGDRTSLTLESWRHNILSGLLSEITWLGLIALAVGIYLLLRKKRRERWLLALWVILPSFVFLYEYMNLHGRAYLIGLLGIAWVWSYVLQEKKPIFRLLSVLLVVQLVSASLPAIISYQSIPPNEKMSYVMTKLEPGGVMITSNGSRTWNKYPGQHLALGDQGAGQILAEINRLYGEPGLTADGQKPIFIHSNTIYHPVWIYDGHSWDIRANGPRDQKFTSLVGNVLSEYQLNIEYLSDNDKEFIYTPSRDIPLQQRIEKTLELAQKSTLNLALINLIDKNTRQPIQRAQVQIRSQNGYFNPERMDSRDGMKRLFHYLKGKSHINNWSLSDRDGLVALPTSLAWDNVRISVSTHPTETRFKDVKLAGFVRQTDFQPSLDNCRKLDNLMVLPDQSFIILADKNERKICAFNFEVEFSDTIDAQYLSGDTGKTKGNYRQGDKGDRAGFLSGGPYLTLDPGEYQVSFYLQTDENTQDETITKIDVSKNAGEPMVEQEIKATDFEKPRQFQSFNLEFSLEKSAKEVEFRTYFLGNANLALEKIRVEKQ